MRKNPTSQFAFFNPRVFAALSLGSAAILLSFYSFAVPVPPSGTLTSGNPTITYTDGPLVTNPTHLLFGTPDCTAPNSCSDFELTVSANDMAATHNVTWIVQWPVVNVDVDLFILKDGNLVDANISYADPATLALSIPADGTVYHLVAVCSVGSSILTGTVSLTPKYPTAQQGAGAPPRFINYAAGAGQANDAGEPSIGVDWNPNIASLKNITPPTKLNTGGVAFFTAIDDQFRSNFDDCSSPAVNLWEDMNSPIITGLDPIGFVDHFRTGPLGTSYPPPSTPGRVFHLQLAAGSSTAAFSDNDGANWTSFIAGGAPAGPDHETLGGGPYHAPIPTPPAPAYPNPMYYCSQNGVQQAQCSRSDDGGLSFGPGVPIFPPTLCAGGIHGHLKVSPQGTVYVPNSACAEGTGPGLGVVGVALSKDNGLTWEAQAVPGSNGSDDPAIGIGQNNVGKPPGQTANTIYLGWIAADGHAHIATSPDEGVTWANDIDVSSIFGIEKAVFPVVVAGDDNRAAFSFLGTDPAFYPAKQVWHLYIAMTYDGGQSWILVDQTPNDPVQIGNICLLGTGCNGARNLLDFNGIDLDAEGRVLVAYADGCVNCANTQPITQSNAAKGTIARQSGGRRLFAAFDPVEPAPPAAPQVSSAVRKSTPTSGVELAWLEPDNGGSPITGYNVYRGATSGTETFLATVSGAGTNKYFDQTATTNSNWFYRVTALNDFNGDMVPDEGQFCREVNVDGAQAGESACVAPFIKMGGPGTAGPVVPSDPTQGELTIQRISAGEPFVSCANNSATLVMKVNTLDPANTGQAVLPQNSGWQILFDVVGTDNVTHTIFVILDTFPPYDSTGIPNFAVGRRDPNPTTGGTVDTQTCYEQPPLFDCPALEGSTFNRDGTISFRLNLGAAISFDAPEAPASGSAFTWNGSAAGTQLANVRGNTFLIVGPTLQTVQTTGTTGLAYTRKGNSPCVAVPPTAVLTGMPLSGSPPLEVDFDASGSTTTNPCGSINSYTMDFGDGSPPVTQSSPLFPHTYNSDGFYAAKLTVKDSTNLVSTNPAQLVITVSSTIPQLVRVESIKGHGDAGPFPINLPFGTAHGIECRSGGATNEYTVVFTFENPLTSVGSASVTGTGSVNTSTSGIDPGDTHKYIANLTGVTSEQTIAVNLTNVQDSAGNLGNVSHQMDVLVGDTNADRFVNSGDISQTKSQSGQAVTISNFREDLNDDGFINSADISLVKSKSGTALSGQTPQAGTSNTKKNARPDEPRRLKERRR